jgi:hypothetical protein
VDKVIKALSEILEFQHSEISFLLVLSRHRINKSSSFGSRAHSTLSTFEIISSPSHTSKLSRLGNDKKWAILDAIHLLFPIMDNSPEITEIIFTADASMSKETEFIQFVDNDELINNISIAINMLERKPPKFWIDYKQKNYNLLEDDFRSEFFRLLGMKYQISSEEESKIGRTDLTIKSSSLNRKIIEFKVWGRGDYKDVSTQLLGYLTEIDDLGIVIMGNSKKNSNIDYLEYEKIIQTSDYVSDSLITDCTAHGIPYSQAEYTYNGNSKKVLHFILNLK